MLVQFAIETEAINNSTTPAHIKRLLDKWERFGILVYPRRGDAALVNAISGLAPATRKYWMSTWEKVIKNNGKAYRWVPPDGTAFEWDKVDTPDALAMFVDELEVAVLEETRAAVLEIPDGESKFCGQVEGVRLWDIDISEKFSLSEALSSASIGVGESIKDVWSRRFQGFAAYSREVVVVDQYAARQNNIEGLLRLLKFLDRDTRSCRVTIYSSLSTSGGDASLIESRIKAEAAQFSGKGIESVGVRVYRGMDFRKYAHDRHLRFDNCVFRIGRGVRIFEHSMLRDATDVHFVTVQPGTREQKEIDLEKFGTRVYKFRVSVV